MTKRKVLKNKTFLNIAKEISQLSTCIRRKVGCVLLDENDFVISTGYNGVPKDHIHCIENNCLGSKFESGLGLSQCEAIHAEINAIIHCENPKKIIKCYVTTSPCINCIKALLGTNCKIIYYEEQYDIKAIEFWRKNGRQIFKL